MAASSTALKTAYQTEVDKISDTLVNAEADYMLDRWIEALDKQQELEANNILSYSIAGRQVTRSNLSEGKALVNSLRAELHKLIYGSVSLVDLNTEVAQPSGTVIS